MSGPVDERALGWVNDGQMGIQVRQGRSTSVGGLEVVRVLPTKGRRTIGGWCFVDLMLPPDVDHPDPMEIGPHPHVGLSTVTWLFSGEALHGDSLGTEQVIRPGQLNLMTAGRGIAHSEMSSAAGVHGAQMWIAQPESTRHGESAFEHHAELPRLEFENGQATVLVGSYGGVTSPARADSPLVGMEITLNAGVTELSLDPSFEYGVVPIDRPVKLNDDIVETGWLGLIEQAPESIRIEAAAAGTRLMFLGGEPLGEKIEMWWNFVARSKDELTDAWRAWQNHDTDLFGPVPSKLARIEAPPPPWTIEAQSG
ncbi:MAG TPA: pirin family protein [Acidimicrobiia bacterium]|nr:pirin family protein [Acidimicrobiia bacterium]